LRMLWKYWPPARHRCWSQRYAEALKAEVCPLA
jgi:hypothetical protein